MKVWQTYNPPSSGFWLALDEHFKSHLSQCQCMINHPEYMKWLVWNPNERSFEKLGNQDGSGI